MKSVIPGRSAAGVLMHGAAEITRTLKESRTARDARENYCTKWDEQNREYHLYWEFLEETNHRLGETEGLLRSAAETCGDDLGPGRLKAGGIAMISRNKMLSDPTRRAREKEVIQTAREQLEKLREYREQREKHRQVLTEILELLPQLSERLRQQTGLLKDARLLADQSRDALGQRAKAGAALLEVAAATLRGIEEDTPEPAGVLTALQNQVREETGPLADLAEAARADRRARETARRELRWTIEDVRTAVGRANERN